MSDKRDFVNKYLPKELKIGIVMGGYLDENNRLMSREELNTRIAANQLAIAKREDLINSIAEQSRVRGYPTASEWNAIVKQADALKGEK